jgi:hypothetical protein
VIYVVLLCVVAAFLLFRALRATFLDGSQWTWLAFGGFLVMLGGLWWELNSVIVIGILGFFGGQALAAWRD